MRPKQTQKSVSRTRLSFHGGQTPNAEKLNLNTSSCSFLNLSFQTSLPERTTIGTTVTTLENKDTSRSNTTVKHREIMDKENISPIKFSSNEGETNNRYESKKPKLWFLKPKDKQIGSSCNNKSVMLLSEEEKLVNARKKLEDDLRETNHQISSLESLITSQTRFFEHKQKEILSELSKLGQADTSKIQGHKNAEFLRKETEMISRFLKTLHANPNFQALYSKLTTIGEEKSRVIEKVFNEEEKLRSLNARLGFLREEKGGYEMKLCELAAEFEELEEMTESLAELHPIEYRESFNRFSFQERERKLSSCLEAKKQRLSALEKERADLEIEAESLNSELRIVNEKLTALRADKAEFKRNSGFIAGLKDKIEKNLDETAKSAIFQFIRVFEDRAFSQSPRFFEILDFLVHETISSSGTDSEAILVQKRQLLSQNTDITNLKPVYTLLMISDQLILNITSGILNSKDPQTLLIEFSDLLSKIRDLHMKSAKVVADLSLTAEEYERKSAELLDITANLAKIRKESSEEMKEISVLKADIKALRSERRETLGISEKSIIKESESMVTEFLSENRASLKEIQFKYGKEYANRLQNQMEHSFLEKSRNEAAKVKTKFTEIFQRKEWIGKYRSKVKNNIAECLQTEFSDLSQQIEETHTLLSSLRLNLREILTIEKTFFLENRSLLAEKDSIINELLLENKRCIDLTTMEYESKPNELSQITQAELFREITRTLEVNLENLRAKELQEIERNQDKLRVLKELETDKKERLRILVEYIQKKGFESKTIQRTSVKNDSFKGEIQRTSVKTDSFKGEIKPKHASSKSLIGLLGKAPAKFGLVTIDLLQSGN